MKSIDKGKGVKLHNCVIVKLGKGEEGSTERIKKSLRGCEFLEKQFNERDGKKR